MCKDIGSTECTGDCYNCGGRTLHAPDAYKRFEKLTHAITERERLVALDKQSPRDHR